MEEELVGSSNDETVVMRLRGKRSKRHRPAYPFGLACSGSTSTSEEEDMANCLILLAQGGLTNTVAKVGFYVYECKTCNRTFPSFQALGGHRASHKKPKTAAVVQEKTHIPIDHSQSQSQFTRNCYSPPLSLQFTNKYKIHECSICGSEFTSGQALGGHMRRHRASAMDHHQKQKRSGNILQLDLNLPAPEDDLHLRDSKFQFIFPSPALVH